METTSYKDLVALVKNYYQPKPSVIVQRYKFNTRSRKQGESVAAYIAALRELAEHCSYGTTLSEMLRDRLVCGVNNETIQRKLLAEKDLTYERAYELALSIETAERDSSQIKKGASGTGPAMDTTPSSRATKLLTLNFGPNSRGHPHVTDAVDHTSLPSVPLVTWNANTAKRRDT